MKVSTLAPLAVSVLAARAIADPVFVGCTAESASFSLLGGLVGGLLNQVSNLFSSYPQTAQGCADSCIAAGGADYSLYSPGLAIPLLGTTLTALCYCETAAPPSSGTVDSVGVSSDQCGAPDLLGLVGIGVVGINTELSVYYLNADPAIVPTFCTDTGAVEGTSSTQPDYPSCFASCGDSAFISVTPNGASYTCACGDVTTNPGSGTTVCGTGHQMTFKNTANPSATQLRRRRRAQQVVGDAKRTLCPGNLVPCAVPTLNGVTYECLDTQAELESCGGCINGLYDWGRAFAPSGVDCTSLPGVVAGGVSCIEGGCVASACAKGFKLSAGRCIAA